MMESRRIREILVESLKTPYFIYPHGSDAYHDNTINCRKSKMFESILNNLLPNTPGDILEIGALTGTSTKVFCETAAKFGRKVFVVDPWNGSQEGSDYQHEQFLNRTAGYNNLVVIKLSSNSDEAIEKIKKMNLAFAFIDGLHTFEFALKDLQSAAGSLSESGVLCLDDINIDDVRRAGDEFNRNNEWNFVTADSFIEAFYCKT